MGRIEIGTDGIEQVEYGIGVKNYNSWWTFWQTNLYQKWWRFIGEILKSFGYNGLVSWERCHLMEWRVEERMRGLLRSLWIASTVRRPQLVLAVTSVFHGFTWLFGMSLGHTIWDDCGLIPYLPVHETCKEEPKACVNPRLENLHLIIKIVVIESQRGTIWRLKPYKCPCIICRIVSSTYLHGFFKHYNGNVKCQKALQSKDFDLTYGARCYRMKTYWTYQNWQKFSRSDFAFQNDSPRIFARDILRTYYNK